MKNLHLIPTDKPSRLWTNNLRRRLELDEFSSQHQTNIAKHIHITNDEVKKHNEWVLSNLNEVVKFCGLWCQNSYKKIILTTDQDLIADGIQSIDDEFLEWFVKNPSCEYVETKIEFIQSPDNLIDGFYYKIIILKEEPKQETLEPDNNFYEKLKQYFKETPREKVLEDWAKSAEFDKIGPTVDDYLSNVNNQEYEYIGECRGNNGNGCFMDSPGHDCGCFIRKPKEELNLSSLDLKLDEVLSKETKESLTTWLNEKRSTQETLEEVAEKYGKRSSAPVFQENHKRDFIEGAKWQQERSYSEEDMINFAFDTYCYISELMKVPFNQISENKLHAMYNFEQYKKK